MVVHLLFGLLIILIGAEFFTNGIEWLGKRMHLSEGVVGNLLAAVGTALPESIIPVVAFCSGSPAANHIGIGAILGAPFMLGTLAMFITGFSAWVIRSRQERRYRLQVDRKLVQRDLYFFIVMYSVVMLAAFAPARFQYCFAGLLLLGYLSYVVMTVKCGRDLPEEGLKPLYLSRSMQPGYFFIFLQLFLGIGAIVGGAQYFISGIDQVAAAIGINPLILSLIIAPIATELPEKFNSVIWVAHNKDGLALGNITGAMVFQSTMIPAFGIIATDWHLDLATAISSFCLMASVVILCGNMQRKGYVASGHLMLCGVAYLTFLLVILWSVL